MVTAREAGAFIFGVIAESIRTRSKMEKILLSSIPNSHNLTRF
jgi:hypothetical protein